MVTHVAIFEKHYLDLVLNNKKTVESRFSKKRIPPYDKIAKGDRILLKEVSGPIRGVAMAGDVFFYRDLNQKRIKTLVQNYNNKILMNSDFLKDKINSRYATLIFLENVRTINPHFVTGWNRSGWVVLKGNRKTLDHWLPKSIPTKSIDRKLASNLS